ncbi:unnamed protein product, partial [Ectocarpus sp. 13 AM-2016]
FLLGFLITFRAAVSSLSCFLFCERLPILYNFLLRCLHLLFLQPVGLVQLWNIERYSQFIMLSISTRVHACVRLPRFLSMWALQSFTFVQHFLVPKTYKFWRC